MKKSVQFTVFLDFPLFASVFHITAVRYVPIYIVLFSLYISILKLNLIEMYTTRIEKH